ncbi:MAG: alpha-L-fucosidase [Victivallales bacterium]|nr:alpha-L-fucosidase [Victivallales bacterium]
MNQTTIDNFRHKRFGLFLHWGLYAVLGGRYKGKTMEYIGEWIQSRFRIPNAEYAQLAKQFNPVKFDAEQWISEAKAAGINYIVITSKHHDGFSMFQTKASDFNIVDATPFHRDPLRELADACAKYDVGFGIYYSQFLDWHEKDGGDPANNSRNGSNMTWSNTWDFPDSTQKDFDKYFRTKVVPQLTELLTNYGPVCELWCDCPLTMKPEYSQQIRDLVHSLQPNCMINSRIGNNCQDFMSLGDNMIMSARSSVPCESPLTLNDTWGFKYDDHNWKSPESIAWRLASLASRNANCLLNIGPQPDGLLPEPARQVLRKLAEWKSSIPEHAISHSEPSPFPQNLPWGCCTQDGNRLQLFVRDWKDSLELNGLQSKVIHADVPFQQDGETLQLQLGTRPESLLPVITLEFAESPIVNQTLVPQNGVLELSPALATIHHGEAAAVSGGQAVGAAGENEATTAHSEVQNDGSLASWHNPADVVEWDVFFPEGGLYDIEVATLKRWSHGRNSWLGQRKVRFEWNGHFSIEKVLTADRVVSIGVHETKASWLGFFRAMPGETGKISLRTLELTNPDAANMFLVNITLTRRPDTLLTPIPEPFTTEILHNAECGFQGSDWERDFTRAHNFILPTLPGGIDNLFFGDSITARWPVVEYFPGKNVLNRGIPGDSIAGLYIRLQRDVFDWCPRRVFLMAGINGIQNHPQEYTFQSLIAITKILQERGIEVVLQSILPLRYPDKWDRFPYMDRIRWVNAQLQDWAAQNHTIYVDHFSTLVDENGQLAAQYSWEDGTHMTPLAYQRLSLNIAPFLL